MAALHTGGSQLVATESAVAVNCDPPWVAVARRTALVSLSPTFLLKSDVKTCKNGSRPLGRNHRFHWGIRLLMVGPRGFEPLTFCTPSKRATRLRYGPKTESSISQSSDEVKWGSRSFVLGQRSLSPENRGRACGKPCKHGLLLEYGSRSGILKKVHFCPSPLPRAPPDRAVECGKPLAKEGRRGGKGRVSECHLRN